MLTNRAAPGMGLDDVFTLAKLLEDMDGQTSPLSAFPKPKHIYRRKEWDVTITAFDDPQLLIPANQWRTSFSITPQFPAVNGFTEYSYGYPVKFKDETGIFHYGIPIAPGDVSPTISFKIEVGQVLGGTVSIDDIYVTVPNLLGLDFPEPITVAAFEQYAQPV